MRRCRAVRPAEREPKPVAAARGFFAWAYKAGRVPAYIADELPRVRQHKAPPRPAPDHAWRAALEAADPRVSLMLRLAGEAGLRRAEVARVHYRDLVEDAAGWSLRVHGKGGKTRVVPLNARLAAGIRCRPSGDNTPDTRNMFNNTGDPPDTANCGWLFPTATGGHLGAGQVGKLVARALPDGWTMHTLRHRFATRALRGHAQPASRANASRARVKSSPPSDTPPSTTARSAPRWRPPAPSAVGDSTPQR